MSAAPKLTGELTPGLLDTWATDPKGPVALHLKQKLVPVEGDDGVIFPPTYADIGYNVDTLSDGTRVATIDSVGSQANRMEPMFKAAADGQVENALALLVPQIDIVLHVDKKGENSHKEKRSIFDLAHRSADAVVQSSPVLSTRVAEAFAALKQTGDAGLLCALAPTSLVFGVWDSRGGTGEKRPRLVRSTIRAWDVETLHTAAQFSSIWKALDEGQQTELQKEATKQKMKLSEKGFADAPAVWRKNDKIPKFRDGAPNPDARLVGGILVRGRIDRDVTVNLVALRGIRGKDTEETTHIRKYLLGLALLAATTEIDLFLREGCHLRYSSDDVWYSVPRRGEPAPVELSSDAARVCIHAYALNAAQHFKPKWPSILEYSFDIKEAKRLLAKKEEESPDEA